MGLGFSFGAKDAGLRSKQKEVAQGFANISAEVEKMGKNATGSSAPISQMTEQLSGNQLDKLTMSIDKLSGSLGKDLPDASKRGAQSMHRSGGTIESAERRIGGGFNFIRDAVEKLHGILRQNKLQTFIQSISLAKLNDIADGIKGLADDNTNLTTSLEATITASNKSAKAMGANFGLTGKALTRFTSQATSMGISLNIGADKAAEASYQMTLATKELGAVGLKSASDLAKFAEVSGVSAADVTQIFKQAGQQFHLTDQQMQQLAGAMLKSGEQIGDVGGQMKMMPQIMELISRRAAVMGKKLSPKQMADFASQTLAVSGAFYAMGASTEDAREMATAMATTMVESGENFGNMFAGTSQDLSDFHTALGIATGDISKSFETMSQGPGEFMSGMADMVMQSKKTGKFTGESMNMLRGQLEKVFGPKQAAMMVNFFSTATDEQLATMKATSKATSDLGKFAKEGFSTGRTLAESFELSKDSFVMNFRSIAREEAVAFVNDTGKEFKKFNKQLSAIAAEGGPLGAMVSKFSEMHQLGSMALIPQTLRPMAAVFGTMLKETGPMIGVLGSLGLRFSHLANPLTLVTVGLGAFIWAMKSAEQKALKTDKTLNQNKKTLAALEKQQARLNKQGKDTAKIDAAVAAQRKNVAAIEEKVLAEAKVRNRKQIANATRTVIEKIGVVLKALPVVVGEAFEVLRDMWPEIGPPIMEALSKAWNWVKQTALPFLFDFAKGVWDGFITGNEAASGSAASKVGASIGKTLRQAFSFALDYVKDYLVNWWQRMGEIWSDPSLSFTEKVEQTFQGSAGIIVGAFALAKFTPIFGILGKLASLMGSVVGPAASKMGSMVWSAAGTTVSAVGSLGSAVAAGATATGGFAARWAAFSGSLATSFPVLAKVLGTIFSIKAAIIGAIAVVAALTIGFLLWPKKTQEIVDKVSTYLRTGFAKMTEIIMEVLWQIARFTVFLLITIIQHFNAILTAIGKALVGALDWIQSAIMGVLDGIENWLTKKFPDAAGVIHVIFSVIKALVVAVFEVVKFAVKAVIGLFKILGAIVGGILKVIWWGIDTFLITPIKFLVGLIKDLFVGAWNLLADAVGWVWDKIEPIIDAIKTGIGAIADAVGWVADKVGGALSAVGGFFSDIGSGISDIFGGGGSLNDAVQNTIKQAQAAAATQTKLTAEQQAAAAALAAKKVEYQNAEKAWEKERAGLEVQHKKDLDARKLTYTQLEVTSKNAAAAAAQASAAAAAGIKNNIELVDKQVRIASTLAMPKMEQTYLNAAKEYAESEKKYQEAVKAQDLEKMNQLGDAQVEILKRQIEQLGISGRQVQELRDEQIKSFTMRADLVDKLSVDEQKAYQASLDQIFDKNFKAQMLGMQTVRSINEQHGMAVSNLMLRKQEELKGLGQFDTKRVEIEKKYYLLKNDLDLKAAERHAQNEQMMLNAKNKATEQKLILEKFMGVKSEEIFNQIASKALTIETDKYAAISALQQRFAAETTNIMQGIPEAMQTAATRAQEEMNRSYFEQLRAITMNEALSIEERKAKLGELEKWKTAQVNAFTTLVQQQEKVITAGGSAAIQSMEGEFSKFSEGLTAKADEAALKAGAAVGTVQKELGVTAQEALTNLTDIAKIDPKRFAEQLKIIKEVYISFAKTAQTETENMLIATGKAFDEFNVRAIDHWNKQKGNIALMMLNEEDIKKLSETVGLTVDRALATLTEMISTKIDTAVTSGFIKAFAKVLVESKKFVKDMMVEFRDLTSQMIKEFANTWIKILDFTTKVLQAIDADTSRAIANLKRIESAMRGTISVKAETAGGDVKQEKKDVGLSELENIFQATHHPAWYEDDFKYKVREMIAALQNLTVALSSSEPKGGSSYTSAKARADIRREVNPGAPGAFRGGSRANGGAGN